MKLFGFPVQNRADGDEQRRFARYDDRPMKLLIGERIYDTEDWSIGGFQVVGFEGPAHIGDDVVCTHIAPDNSPRGQFIASVAWLGPDNRVGLKLTEIDGLPMV